MKLNYLFGCLVYAFILQSCGDTRQEQPNESTPREVAFTSTVEWRQAVLSRASNASWDRNDRIGVYLLQSGTETILTENRSFTTTAGDGSFTVSEGSMEYPAESFDVIAYYPYSEATSDFIYKVDVSDQSDPAAIDLLYSDNLTGRDQTSVTGNLQFRHRLSRLRLNLSSPDGTETDQLTATVSGIATRADFNLKDGSFSIPQSSATGTVQMQREGNTLSALLLPTSDVNAIKLHLTLDGKTQEVSLPSKIVSLEANNDYSISVSIKNGGSQIEPEASAYFKQTETPAITDSQLKQYHYLTHFCPDNSSVRNYSMLYDSELMMAYWVAYPLCSYYLGDATRTDKWQYDPSIDTSLQTNMKSGIGGYDRGHQIPSADRTRSSQLNYTTFYYTNMTPQVGDMNQQIWQKLENQVRGWASGIDTLFVVTGAMPTTPTDKSIDYTTNKNDGKLIAVPKYYFKALARKLSGTFYTIAFKIENTASVRNDDYMNYALSVADLEKETGFTFFPSLDASAKSTLDTSKWN